MKIRYLKVTGENIKPLPDKYQAQATHSVNLTNANYNRSGFGNDWKLVDGEPVLKSIAEVDADGLKRTKKSVAGEAFQLADRLKKSFIFKHTNEKVYEFSPYAQLRFFQEYAEQGEQDVIRVRVKDSKSVNLNRSRATILKTKIEEHESAVEDALDADLDDIVNEIFTLSNLRLIDDAQQALRK